MLLRDEEVGDVERYDLIAEVENSETIRLTDESGFVVINKTFETSVVQGIFAAGRFNRLVDIEQVC